MVLFFDRFLFFQQLKTKRNAREEAHSKQLEHKSNAERSELVKHCFFAEGRRSEDWTNTYVPALMPQTAIGVRAAGTGSFMLYPYCIPLVSMLQLTSCKPCIR